MKRWKILLTVWLSSLMVTGAVSAGVLLRLANEEGKARNGVEEGFFGAELSDAGSVRSAFENPGSSFNNSLKATAAIYEDHKPVDDCNAMKPAMMSKGYAEHAYFHAASDGFAVIGDETGHVHTWEASGEPELFCEENGRQLYVCSCGESYYAVLPPAGHNFVGEWETVEDAEGDADGLEVRYCTRCEKRQERVIPGPLHEHMVVEDVTAEPTCTESGHRGGKHCDTCWAVLEEPEIVPALGHDFGDWGIVKEPTEEEEGWEVRHCSRCPKEEGRMIDKKPHTHVWGDWTVILKPTALAEGTRERTCDSCGETETESIPALGRTTIRASMVTLSSFSFTYNGKTRRPTVMVKVAGKTLRRGADYTVSIPTSVKVGKYKLVVTGKGEYEGTVTKYYRITKAANPMKVKNAKKTLKAYNLKNAAKGVAPLKVSLAQGIVTFKKSSGSARLVVNGKTGKIKVKKGTKKGTYKAKIIVTAAGNSNYWSVSKTVNVAIVVN